MCFYCKATSDVMADPSIPSRHASNLARLLPFITRLEAEGLSGVSAPKALAVTHMSIQRLPLGVSVGWPRCIVLDCDADVQDCISKFSK